jgi:hypothetical protein
MALDMREKRASFSRQTLLAREASPRAQAFGDLVGVLKSVEVDLWQR